MKKIVCKTADKLLWIYSFMGVIFLLLVILSTFLQVTTRYFLEASLPWTEEGARYAFIWMSMMGASLATRHGTNATIDILSSFLKGKTKKIHAVIIQAAVLFAAALIFPYGIQMVHVMMMRASAALGIPMGYVYLAIPIGCVGIMVQCAANMLELLVPGKEAA